MIHSSQVQTFIATRGGKYSYDVKVKFFDIVVFDGVLSGDHFNEVREGLRMFFTNVCGLKFDSPAFTHSITQLYSG